MNEKNNKSEVVNIFPELIIIITIIIVILSANYDLN